MRALLLVLCLSFGALPAFAQDADSGPKINDPNLTVEVFAKGIPGSPTTMTFVGNDILVLQKSDGQVRLIRNGVLQPNP
ncbi:MAG: quinoprotein glucose dehydrogenase, partial [Candidatus Nitrosotenuis sp.]